MMDNSCIELGKIDSNMTLCLICRDNDSLTIDVKKNCKKNTKTGNVNGEMLNNESAIYLFQLKINESRSSQSYIHIVSHNLTNIILNCSL